jgi:hypothetical protein
VINIINSITTQSNPTTNSVTNEGVFWVENVIAAVVVVSVAVTLVTVVVLVEVAVEVSVEDVCVKVSGAGSRGRSSR